MCQTDYDYELGEAKGGTVIYASLKDLKEHRGCVNFNPLTDGNGKDTNRLSRCGIIKVRIELQEILQKEEFKKK